MRPFPRADLVVAGSAVTVLLVAVFSIPEAPCTVAVPCRPEPVAAPAVGMPAAVVVMSFVHRWAAVGAAVACSAVWLINDRWAEPGLGWRGWLPLVLVAVTAVVARLRWKGPAGVTPTRQQPPVSQRLAHETVFPRMVAVVHHGGAGTTAAAVRAGCRCSGRGDSPRGR